VLSATIAIEFAVGARVEVEGIPDPATPSNVLVSLAAAERRGCPSAQRGSRAAGNWLHGYGITSHTLSDWRRPFSQPEVALEATVPAPRLVQ
jgi:hypothetical protein